VTTEAQFAAALQAAEPGSRIDLDAAPVPTDLAALDTAQLGQELDRRNRVRSGNPMADERYRQAVHDEIARRQVAANLDPLVAYRDLTDVELAARRARAAYDLTVRPTDVRLRVEADCLDAEAGRRALASERADLAAQYVDTAKAAAPKPRREVLGDLLPEHPTAPVIVRRAMPATYRGEDVGMMPGTKVDANDLGLPPDRLRQLVEQRWVVEQQTDPGGFDVLTTAHPTPEATEADRQRTRAREYTRKSRERRRSQEQENSDV
jgi:hypothetical protein